MGGINSHKFSNNSSSSPNCKSIKNNEDPNLIKQNIENIIKNKLVPKYFEGRDFSYKTNKWQQEFLDELENYCSKQYSNYKFYFWCAIYERKNIGFNSNDKVHFYSETDVNISIYLSLTKIGIDIGGIGIKNLNLTHSKSINDFKTELRNKIEIITENTLEGRTFCPGEDEGNKYLNFILDEVMEYVKSKDNFPYYYIVGTIFKKGTRHSICERYINQTTNFGSVYLIYENNSVQSNVYVFSCI